MTAPPSMPRPARPRRADRADRADAPRPTGGAGAGSGPGVSGRGAQGGGGVDPLRYATAYHAPVLAAETVAGLVTDPAGLYVDGTLGGGGHSAALLDALGPDALVVGIDRDPEAIAAARERLAEADGAGRFRALQGEFADIDGLLGRNDLGPRHGRPAQGVLLDLGVSSHQIDAGARGFAFSAEGPLDMRMSGQGETAADLVARLGADDLADVLYAYGEERRSRRIAGAIKSAHPQTTTALADAVRSVVPTRDETKTLARVFQALRIAVNGELDQLEAALPAALGVLGRGGRLAVIAYHSLEDRRAKQFLRTGTFSRDVPKDLYGNPLTPWKAVTRKPVVASDDEVEQNPRSRSARLRVAQKTADIGSPPMKPSDL